jgi:hypothetical protein
MQPQDGIVSPDRVTSIRHVGINRGVEWIGAGFNLLMKKPGELIVGGLIIFVLSIICHAIPVLGSAVATMVGVVAAGVFMRVSQAIEEGHDPIEAAKASAGATPLYILGVVAAAIGLVIALAGWAMGAAALGMAFLSVYGALAIGAITGLLMIFVSIPVVMALWLAPGLVIFKGTEPVEAVRLSFAASVKNFLPFIVFYILSAIAAMIGALLMGVGLIVVYPVLLCAAYFAYKDIFGSASTGEAVGFIQP